MAGKIIADQIEHSTAGSLDTQYVVNGSAKAWAEIDGDAATVVAFDSFNASSFDDDGTGLYTFHLSSSMSDANYCMATNAARNANITTSNRSAVSAAEDSNSVLVGLRNLSNTEVDAEHIGCVVFGDLA